MKKYKKEHLIYLINSVVLFIFAIALLVLNLTKSFNKILSSIVLIILLVAYLVLLIINNSRKKIKKSKELIIWKVVEGVFVGFLIVLSLLVLIGIENIPFINNDNFISTVISIMMIIRGIVMIIEDNISEKIIAYVKYVAIGLIILGVIILLKINIGYILFGWLLMGILFIAAIFFIILFLKVKPSNKDYSNLERIENKE